MATISVFRVIGYKDEADEAYSVLLGEFLTLDQANSEALKYADSDEWSVYIEEQ